VVVGSTGEFRGREVWEFVEGGAGEVDSVEPVDGSFVAVKMVFSWRRLEDRVKYIRSSEVV